MRYDYDTQVELDKPIYEVRVWDAFYNCWVAIPSPSMPYLDAVTLALDWADDFINSEVQVYKDSRDGLVLMGFCEYEPENVYYCEGYRNADNGFVFKEVF